jgi:isoleucyl-tRNA synthetase
LHVLATALFDRPSFKTCVVHGVLLGDDGQKLSKRLANYPDPMDVFDTVGSDAMRWALLSSAVVRGGDMVVDRRSMEEAVRHVLMPIWNAWYFLSLYANASGLRGEERSSAEHVLDRYALAKVGALRADVTDRLDLFDLSGACASILDFLDSLNNWYIRRSRDRFWAGDKDAVDTLHTVLSVLCRVAAPLLPLTTDGVYRDLTGRDSVHLDNWPSSDDLVLDVDPNLVDTMDQVRAVCSAAASVRKANAIPNRQPLSKLTVATPDADALRAFEVLIADEANVKSVELTTDVGATGQFVLQLVPAVLGPRAGADMQRLVGAVRAGNWTRDGDDVVVEGRTLQRDEYTLRLVAREGTTSNPLPDARGVVALDTEITPDLAQEGLARFVVRRINDLRRRDGLHVTDRIHLVIDVEGYEDLREVIEKHRSYIMDETLAEELVVDGPLGDGHHVELPDGRILHVGLSVPG